MASISNGSIVLTRTSPESNRSPIPPHPTPNPNPHPIPSGLPLPPQARPHLYPFPPHSMLPLPQLLSFAPLLSSSSPLPSLLPLTTLIPKIYIYDLFCKFTYGIIRNYLLTPRLSHPPIVPSTTRPPTLNPAALLLRSPAIAQTPPSVVSPTSPHTVLTFTMSPSPPLASLSIQFISPIPKPFEEGLQR